MACLELVYKDTNVIIKDGKDTELSTTQGFSILYDFLTTGNLPIGYFIEGDLKVSRETLFDEMLNLIINAKNNNELFIKSITNKNEQDFINKLIGNNTLSSIVDDYDNFMDHNVLINTSWGESTNWYGFTDKRMVLITGNRRNINSPATKKLSYIYNELKLGNERFNNYIQTLYNKYNQNNVINVYARLTWLANNHLDELITWASLSYNSSLDKNETEIKNLIKTNPLELAGTFFVYKDTYYLIPSNLKRSKENITVLNISNNLIEEIPISKIKRLYSPITVSLKNNEYMLIKNVWYKINSSNENENLIRVDDDISEELFRDYLGILNNDKIIDIYKLQLKGSDLIDGDPLYSILPEGSRIKTATGFYIKQNGAFNNLDPKEMIYEVITYDQSIINKLISLKNLNSDPRKLSISEVRVLLYDLYNIGHPDSLLSFDDITFNYKSDGPSVEIKERINKSEDGYSSIPYLSINANFSVTKDNYDLLNLAINYLSYLKSSSQLSEVVKDAKSFWKKLVNYMNTKEVPNKDLVLEETMNMLLPKETDESVLISALDQNLADIKSLQNQDIDSFMNKLLDLGIFIVSCER